MPMKSLKYSTSGVDSRYIYTVLFTLSLGSRNRLRFAGPGGAPPVSPVKPAYFLRLSNSRHRLQASLEAKKRQGHPPMSHYVPCHAHCHFSAPWLPVGCAPVSVGMDALVGGARRAYTASELAK